MRAKEFIIEAFDTDAYAREQAEKYGIPFSMVQHAMNKETGHIQSQAGRAGAVSHKGAQGFMQLMPGTAKELGVKDPFNAKQNIQGGIKYLSQMLNRFQDPKVALAAYNYGPGNVNKWLKKGGDVSKLPKETRKYIAGYNPDAEQEVAAAPIGLPKNAAEKATKVLATVSGSGNAYGKDEIPQRKVTPVATQKFPTAPFSTPQYPTAAVSSIDDTTINRGDTLTSIAKSKGISVQDIMSMNPEITDPNKISAGAKLRISTDR